MAKNYRKAYGDLYVKIDVPHDMLYTCFYCGCIATDWDHVPPLSRAHDYRAVYDRHPPIMVPACVFLAGLVLLLIAAGVGFLFS